MFKELSLFDKLTPSQGYKMTLKLVSQLNLLTTSEHQTHLYFKIYFSSFLY